MLHSIEVPNGKNEGILSQTKPNQIKSNQTIVILTGCHSPTYKRGRFNKLFNQL